MAGIYGPRKWAAFGALWHALTRGRESGSAGLGERLKAFPRMTAASLSGRYRILGRGRLALLVLAIAYLISPVDFVPESFLTVFGLIDDGVVALWLAGAFLVETQRFLAWEADAEPMVVAGELA